MATYPAAMTYSRRVTRELHVGSVAVGGGSPISVQSMTTTKTADVDATLAQIYALAGAGADIVRVTCNTVEAAQGIAEMMPRAPVPIVADIHFQHRLALAAIEAGVSALRLNPGNIRNEQHIKAVAVAAQDAGIPIRIGVNAGSLDKDLLETYGGPVPEALVASAMQEVRYFDDVGFHDVKISVKHSNVRLMVESYRLLADTTDYPLHLGVTEAGPPPGGLIKSVAGIATLLNEGIGDTIRFSLTADSVEEAKAGRSLLEYLGLRERSGLDLIACPSCGRAEVDVIAVASEANERLEELDLPIQVAVMGCVVNGPGEAREADLGLAAGRGKGHLFIKGEVVRVVPEAEMVDALVTEAKLLSEQGAEARLAAADVTAADFAAEERLELITIQGDVNHAAERRAAVADVAGETSP
jgi:(E)-4-hydroxy-3-methylbut-2-enyl-diphosphate synthase